MGRPTRLAHPLTALALTVALSACTSTTADPAPTATGTTAHNPGSVPAATATTTPQASDQEQLTALWEAVHAERLRQLHSNREPDAAPFEPYATGDATDAILDHIRAGRSDIDAELVDVEHWTDTDVAPDGRTAELADCLIVAERPADDPQADPTVRSRVWSATATDTDDGWKLDNLSAGINDCLPPDLNDQLLEAYRGWHEAKRRWWDPPDPNHPLLDEAMTDPGLSDMRDLLTEHRSMGIVVRDGHDLENAVVFELAIGQARVSDCFPAHPENIAAYDEETGERREDLSPRPTPGQIDRTIVDLERSSNDDWVVKGWRSRSDTDCTPGGSPYVVGP